MANAFGQVTHALEQFTASHPGVKALGFGNNSNFGESSSPAASNVTIVLPPPNPEMELLNFVLIAIAVYMAMKCKKFGGGVDIVQLIFAICLAPFYILYRLWKPCATA
jgi:hypothetical protein